MGRNPENNKKMLDSRNAQILEIAVELFAKQGLTATRIQDIATKAGISQGLIYHYYKSKEEIFTELIRSAFKAMNSRLVELEQLQVAPEKKIRMAIDALLKGFAENKHASWYYLLITQAGISESIPSEAKKIITEASNLPHEIMTRIIQEGQAVGTIGKGNASQMALVFWSLIKGIALHIAVHGTSGTIPDAVLLLRFFDIKTL